MCWPSTSGWTRPARAPCCAGKGLYTSLITAWREQRDKGALAGLAAARGPKPADPGAAENRRLVAENARLAAELANARQGIRVQGELSALLQQLSQQSADRPESEPEE
jgi:transposase